MIKGKYPVNFIGITNGYHTGKCLDFGWNSNYGGKNQPILAFADGAIKKIETQKTGGLVLYIEHKDGIVSQYAHLDSISVKVGDDVLKGEVVAIMGNSGTNSSGFHLHFGLFSSMNLIYKNSDIDPFEVCEVYEDQIVANGTLDKYSDKLKYYTEYELGLYVTLQDINLRTEANSYSKQVKYEDMTTDGKKNAVYTENGDNAVYKEGTRFDVLEIVKNDANQVYGKTRSGWVCLVGSYGVTLCKKVD